MDEPRSRILLVEDDEVRAFRKAQSLVATLILTAHGSFDNAVEAIRANADDFVTKPIDPSAFVERIRELMGLTAARIQESREVVLAIGAHPDDVEIGCGGSCCATSRAATACTC